MLRIAFLGIFAFTFTVSGQNSALILWNDLKAKRESATGIHQEFEVIRSTRTASTQTATWRVVVDMSRDRWREERVGLGAPIRVFDGTDTLTFEPDEKEYVRVRRGKTDNPAPSPYDLGDVEWSKATELGSVGCKVEGADHTCITVEVPLKKWIKGDIDHQITQLTSGALHLVMDTDTGLLMLNKRIENIQGHDCNCQKETDYTAKVQASGSATDEGLFRLPVGHTQAVKELAAWDAERIKRSLVGKAAPAFGVTDISGAQIQLDSLRGKTVLLDFWASWCLPCREDLPALAKLYQKYGGANLAIVAIDLGEDRTTIQKYLKHHPSKYPVALSAENALSRQYEPSGIPTYIVIGSDGVVQGAADGSKGFLGLKDLLKKAGWDVN